MTSKQPNAAPLFECTCCGECCQGYGGTMIRDVNIVKIARFVDLGRHLFLKKYCVKSSNGWMVAQREDGYCHFAKDKHCSIHPVKPRICRAWPFLESVLADFSNWGAMASVCPGINKKADPRKVRAAVKAQIAAEEKPEK